VTRYEHTQIGHVIIWSLLAIILIASGGSFGISVIRKRVGLAEIVGCEPIRIRWWYGWGIHLTPYGWLYNVSGFDAVAITLRDGRKFAFGTDDPDGLVDAIRRYTSTHFTRG